MSTHKAIATTSKGVLEEIDRPTPLPGPGEVLIQVKYAGMIAFDTYQLDRAYYVSEYPHVLGFSASGVVESIGEGVNGLKIGDKVASFNYPSSNNKSIQEYSLVSRYVVAKLPPNYPLDQAASIPDNYVTAFWTLFGSPNLALPHPTFPPSSPPPDADSPILVYGAGTSAGQYTVQLLRLAGYTNILATASPRNHALLHSLGATKCFDYRSPDLTKQILEATGGQPVKYAVDPIAARPTLQAVSAVIGKGSTLAILIPVKEGETVTNEVDSEMHTQIPTWATDLFKDVELRPVYTFRYQEEKYTQETIMPIALPQLLEKGSLKPNRIRLLDQGTLKERVEIGLDLLRNNKVSGEKVVVKVSD